MTNHVTTAVELAKRVRELEEQLRQVTHHRDNLSSDLRAAYAEHERELRQVTRERDEAYKLIRDMSKERKA